MAARARIAGVVAALSVTSDLTRGHPPGEAMRACLLAVELAGRAGLVPQRCGEVYYAALMRFAGCAATSHEAAAALGGDDIVVRARGDLIDATRPQESLRFVVGLGVGIEKLRILAMLPRMGNIVAESARADCEVGADLAARLDLPEPVRRAVLCAFERYDGKGSPAGLAGEEVPEAARFAAVGYAAVMFDAVGGAELAVDTVKRWSGRALDPSIAGLFLADPVKLLRLSDPDDLWTATVTAEPTPGRVFRDDDHLDEALAGFGDAADLKAPFFQGHSRGVAALARSAAGGLGVDPTLAYRAGLLHDLGRVAVPTGVWERPGRLRPEEWELVRLHPYHSGRIVARSPVLEPLSASVSRHHERIDGSGYPAGMSVGDLDMASRLLAAADVWRTLGEARPHRPASGPAEAARLMATMPLDRDAVRAVMKAADAPRSSLPTLPVELTERELEVLRLLVAGLTKRQVAEQLVVSSSTVHTHGAHLREVPGVHPCGAGDVRDAPRAHGGPCLSRGPISIEQSMHRIAGVPSVERVRSTSSQEHTMSTRTTTLDTVRAAVDVEAVLAGFQAVGAGDIPAFAARFHPDATWNHRNPDRLGGVKEGIDAIVGFLAESMALTAGTLRPVPATFLPDGAGHVAVLTRITATRPDGRSFADTQVLYFTLDGDRVRSVDQFVGDPPAVTAFWA